MELYQLTSFVAVAEEGHMTKAAERLNVSQPAVSAHIKTLESELGVTLFFRTPKGMELTQEGVELKERSVTILESVDDLRAAAEKLKGGIFGDIHLGVNTDPRLLRLSAIYEQLNQCYSGLSLNVLETMSWDAEHELLSRNVDLAFTYSKPADKRIQVRHIAWIEMAIVAPISWQERLTNVTLNDLHAFPWVWTSKHCPLNALQEAMFAEVGSPPKKAVVVDQEAAIMRLVSEGVGLSILPILKTSAASDSYQVFTAKKLDKKLELSLIYLKNREYDQKVRAVKDTIFRVWELDTSTR
jgi:DNA-binding transcriptional LysR family regulator